MAHSHSAPTKPVKSCGWLCLLPIATFCFVPGSFIITLVVRAVVAFLCGLGVFLRPVCVNVVEHGICRYLIAVYHNHVHPLLPMISETGEELPENFVFAIIVNVGAFFGR